MKNKDFNNIDKLAQEAFEHFEVPFHSEDWMAFQEHLDNESAIDAIAKDALANYEVPLDPHGWDEFEQLHQKKKGTVLYIWWYKAAEAGAMALLLLATFLNLPCSNTTNNSNSSLAYGSTTTLNSSTVISPISSTSSEQEASPEQLPPPTTNMPEQETFDNNSVSSIANGNPSLENTGNTSNTSTSSPDVTNKPVSSKKTTAAPVATILEKEQDASNQKLTQETSNSSSSSAPMASIEEPSSNTTTVASTNTTALDESTNNHLEQTSKTQKEEPTTALQLKQLLAIQSHDLKLATSTTQQATIEPITTISSTELKAPYACKHYLGAVLGVGANMGTSMGKTSIGYNGGMTYEKEYSSKFSLSVGLLASYKRYDRTDVITLNQSTIDGKSYQMTQVKNSNLILVEIPLDVNYTCFRSDKWRIYATAGLSANGIFSRIYTGSQEVEIDGLTISTELNSNDFERGLVEGGAAQQNLYLSIGGGIGVERKLGDNLSLYLLPTYRHGINQVHSDLIHTFNVNIGIKKAL